MRKRRRIRGLFLLAAILILAGCGEKKAAYTDGREVYVKQDKSQDKSQKEETEPEEQSGEEQLFLVTGLDTEQKKITLKGCNEQEEKEFTYTGATEVKDKYGSNTVMEKLAPGEMVNVELEKDTVKTIQASDEVFTYGEIHNFALDTEAKTITVGKNSYYYGEDIQVFYRNNKISIAEISDRDTICLKGIDKKVYAIQVISGHGTVVLQNTDIFEGGNITIGNVLSMDIEADMRIEVPEGTYLLSVANNGYGGNSEITVEANRETTVNLEELKGEGPKYCTIAFVIEPENATLYLNGEVVDLSQSLQLKYGRYSLSAKAEGYADWNRTLVVNSESANIKIELQTEAEAAEEAEEAQTENQTETNTQTDSNTQTESNTQTDSGELTDAVNNLVDYLTTSNSSTAAASTGSTGNTGTSTTDSGYAGNVAGSSAGSLAGSH